MNLKHQFLFFKSFLLNRSKNPLLRGTLVYTIASAINALIPFLLIPILTEYLSPEEYGVVSTFMVCSSIFLLLIGTEQQGFIAVNFFKFSSRRVKELTSNVLYLSVFLFVLLLVTVSLVPEPLEKLLEINRKWIILATIVGLLQFITQLNLLVWQLRDKPVAYGKFQIANSLANYLISLALIIAFSMADDGRIIGICVASLLLGGFSFAHLATQGYLNQKADLRIIKSSLAFSVPLLPHALAGWVNTGLDKILINNIVSVEENGRFSIAFQIAMVIGLIASSFNRAFLPYIFKILSKPDAVQSKHKIVRYTYYYYAALALLSVLLYLTAPFVISFVVDEKYYGAIRYIPWLIVGFFFDGLYYGVVNFIYYSKKTHFVSLITFASCIVHFLLSYTLMPRFGTIAAAYATAGSYALSFVLAFLISNIIYPMPWFTAKDKLA